MTFGELAEYFERIEKTASRLEMTEILAELFTRADENEVASIVYLTLGRLAPKYEGIIFQLAEKMMIQVVAQGCAADPATVEKLYKKLGDLGVVAEKLKNKKTEKQKNRMTKNRLNVIEVYDRLWEVAKEEGEGSQDRKVMGTAKILQDLDALSARYVTRIPVGKLRLGFSDKTILDALSWMEYGDKRGKARLDAAYHVVPDVGTLAQQVKKVGIAQATENPKPVVGVPVLPMLAQRLKSPAEMIQKMGRVAVEPKLDGLRVLIHFKRQKDKKTERQKNKGDATGFVKTFTRNLNETSWMFPELDSIGEQVEADELILDSEAVGIDEETKKQASFQTTMTRRRKHEIGLFSSQVPIQFHVFDILLKDGDGVMDLPYTKRRTLLENVVRKGTLLQLVESVETEDPKVIETMNVDMRAQGLEGIIVKKLDSPYVPGRTGWRWVKMKESEEAIAKLADTVDCVVMGYSAGRGKRAVFGVGQFLVGVRGGEEKGFDEGGVYSVTKVGTGLTDEQFVELKQRLGKLEVGAKPREYIVDKHLYPDVWVRPELIVEIAADEVTKSPSHTAGLALRFPRLVGFRDDKDLEQSTSVSELKHLFELQGVSGNKEE